MDLKYKPCFLAGLFIFKNIIIMDTIILVILILLILATPLIVGELSVSNKIDKLIKESEEMKKSIKENRDKILNNMEKSEENG